jgi:hypothetical protein
MISLYRLWESKQRLKSAQKTVDMFGGEDGCHPQFLAQRDMIELEVEYHRLGVKNLFRIFLIVTILAFFTYMYYTYGEL